MNAAQARERAAEALKRAEKAIGDGKIVPTVDSYSRLASAYAQLAIAIDTGEAERRRYRNDRRI